MEMSVLKIVCFVLAVLLATRAGMAQPRTIRSGAQPQTAGSRPQQEFASITNFLWVNKQICTGGQPTMEDLAKLKAAGIKAVINLRRPNEYATEEEAAKAEQLGLRYFNIPVNGAEPKDEQAKQFLKITADPKNRPAFIHCSSANRVGGFWMIRRVLVDGWKLEDAEREAEKIGLRAPVMREFARDYIRRHQKK
jgi:uncharacterized protein (TIGR01244 family)